MLSFPKAFTALTAICFIAGIQVRGEQTRIDDKEDTRNLISSIVWLNHKMENVAQR